MAQERQKQSEDQHPELGAVGKAVRRAVLGSAVPITVAVVVVGLLFLWAVDQVWRVGLQEAVVTQERTWGHRYVVAEADFLRRRMDAIETSLRRFGANALEWRTSPAQSTSNLTPRGQAWHVDGDKQKSEALVFSHPTLARAVLNRAGGDRFDPQAQSMLLVDPAVEAGGLVTFDGAIRRLPADHLEDRIRDREQLLNLRSIRETARLRGRGIAWYTGGTLSNAPPAQQAGAAFPVLEEGNITAVVFVELDARQFVPNVSLERGEWSILVDASGSVVASDSMGTEVMGRIGSKLTNNPLRTIAAFGNRLQEKPEGEWEVSTRKGTWLCSYVTLAKPGWKLVLARPMGMPEGAAKSVWNRALVASLLFSVLLLLTLPLIQLYLKRRADKMAFKAEDVVSLLETSLDELGRDTPLTAAGEDRFPELESLLNLIRYTSRDVGTHRRELEREKERLATILRSLDVGVAVMDRRFNVVYINDVIRNRHGDSLVGKRASWIVEDNPWEGTNDARMVMEDGNPHTVRKRIPIGGEERVYQVTYFPIINTPGGRVEGFGEVTTDVTELAGLQAQLARMAEDLKEKNEILNQNNSELQRADRLKSEFIGNVSHELRTPMNSVLGYSRILLRQEEDLPESTRHTLEQIEKDAVRLMELIEALLELTRLDAGSIVPNIRTFPILDLVEELMKEYKHLADDKGLSFEFEAPPSDLIIQQDYERLHQVMVALLNNAVKFTEEGFIKIGIRREGPDLEFCVKDSGSGIPSDELAHIFERFHQSDGSVTRRHGGIGLGLTLAMRMTELLGGSIRVDSAEGEGTCFTVRIPRDLQAHLDNAVPVDTRQSV